MASHVLVLGLGNILLGDDGLGVRAVERLIERYRLPAGVEAVDGGVIGLYLLPRIEDAGELLVLDAVQSGRAPGSLVRLAGDELPALLAQTASMHQVGLQELLALCALRGTRPARVVLCGLEPGSVETGIGLTPAVAAQLDALVDAAAGELRAWGLAVEPA